MTGHEFIVALRRKGLRPASVWLDVGCNRSMSEAVKELNRLSGACHVAIELGDPIERLDLRFVFGCEVYVHGLPEADPQVVRAYDAARKAGACRVIAFVGDDVIDSAERVLGSRSAAHG